MQKINNIRIFIASVIRKISMIRNIHIIDYVNPTNV